MDRENALKLIDRCIVLCNEQKQLGYPGEATQEQVENYILPEMVEIRKKILSNDLPANRFVLAFAYAFKVWGWKMKDATELYLTLLRLNSEYERAHGDG